MSLMVVGLRRVSTIAAAAVVYFATASKLRIEEAGEFLSIVSRKLGKK